VRKFVDDRAVVDVEDGSAETVEEDLAVGAVDEDAGLAANPFRFLHHVKWPPAKKTHVLLIVRF
jgi:hypothetical protein